MGGLTPGCHPAIEVHTEDTRRVVYPCGLETTRTLGILLAAGPLIGSYGAKGCFRTGQQDLSEPSVMRNNSGVRFLFKVCQNLLKRILQPGRTIPVDRSAEKVSGPGQSTGRGSAKNSS